MGVLLVGDAISDDTTSRHLGDGNLAFMEYYIRFWAEIFRT
jgi:hypothetical protein